MLSTFNDNDNNNANKISTEPQFLNGNKILLYNIKQLEIKLFLGELTKLQIISLACIINFLKEILNAINSSNNDNNISNFLLSCIMEHY